MVTQEVLARVLACYRLGELKVAHRIERGFVNENWLVETTRGRYFLKQIGRASCRERVCHCV